MEQREAARRTQEAGNAPATASAPATSAPTSVPTSAPKASAERAEPNEADVSEFGVALSNGDASNTSASELAPPIDATLPYFSVFPPSANAGSQKLTAVTEEDETGGMYGLGLRGANTSSTEVSGTALSPPTPPTASADRRPS